MKPHNNDQYVGETFRGKIIHTGGTEEAPDLIAVLDGDVPNAIINNLDPEEVSLEDRVKVRVDDAIENAVFGEAVDDEGKGVDQVSNGGKDFVVEFSMFGYTFRSETISEESAAADLADFLAPKIEKEVNVERKR